MIKISFIGDIMCEKPLQKCYMKHRGDTFNKVFEKTKSLFSESDYVVGNLETVFAGKERGYTDHIYCFNTPDSFAAALAESGIDMVTTATNHSLDRGTEGLFRTINVLKHYGIDFTGTNKSENLNRYFIKEINGTRIAFLSYTYGTNTHETNVILSEDERYCLNLIKPQTYRLQKVEGKVSGSLGIIGNVKKKLSSFITAENRMRINKLLHRRYNVSRVDVLYQEDKNEIYYDILERDIKSAKENSDIVIVCSHMGGQFNAEPGEFAKYIAQLCVDYGADYVIANHPHVVQKHEIIDGSHVCYCLGNYSISPSSVYLLHDLKPEYSVCYHLYLDDNGKTVKCTFSILKIVETKDGSLTVWPVYDLYKILADNEKNKLISDVQFIQQRFCGSSVPEICKEYEIKQQFSK